jgi:hypothetical protein
MTDFKRKTLILNSGKQIKLYGNSLAIGKTLEIGEGYAPNIFSCGIDPGSDKAPKKVANPWELNKDELLELADYNIRLWMDLKDNIRKFGVSSPKIFNGETFR